MQSFISRHIKGKTLIMIDAANLESSVKDLGWWVDYAKLRELFDGDNLHDIRFYSVHHNTENQNQFFTFLKRHGYTLITKPLKIIKQRDIEAGDIRKANFVAKELIETSDKYIDLKKLQPFIERKRQNKSPSFPTGG
ncbi:MAG: NYN domain-containing protein [Patescibacteria group bacterium]